jgi:hypothetical protein
MLGAYLQTFKNDGKTEFVLNNFIKFYPTAPIYLVSDKGDDFSDIAKKYSCSYSYSVYNLGVRDGGYDKYEMQIWLNRLRAAIEYCKTDYLLYLEDDVLVRGFIDTDGIIIAGVQENHIPINIIKYLENKYKVTFNADRYGTCGGAIYHCGIFLKLFEEISNIVYDDFDNLKEYGFGYLDIFMPSVYMALGYKYQRNHNIIETERVADWKSTKHPIVHGKKIYG